MAAITTIPYLDDAVKLRFAEVFARTKNASTAAMQTIQPTGEALRWSYILPTDPVVLAELERLKDDVGEAELLPSKYEAARDIWDRAHANNIDNEDYERLMKLYCNVMDFIPKPGTNTNVAVTVAPVMVVRDHGTNDEWAAKVAAQQRGLVLDAAS